MTEIDKLLEYLKRDGVSLLQISKDADVAYGVLNRFVNDRSDIKAKDFLKLKGYLFPKSENGSENDKNELNEEAVIYRPGNSTKTENEDYKMKSIYNLTETNKNAVNNCTRLLALLEAEISSRSQPVAELSDIIAPVIEMMARAGVPSRWKSVDEGILELGILMAKGVQAKTSQGNLSGVGK